jgi:hypothetical protein
MTKQQWWPMPQKNLEEFIDAYLVRRLRQELAGFVTEARMVGSDTEIMAAHNRVMEIRGLRRALVEWPRRVERDGIPIYVANVQFLKEAFRAVTKTRDEHLVYATGPEDGKSVFALTRILSFDYETQSVCGASPDPRTQLKALMDLDRTEERLLATIHSHPGRGVNATHPSSVDLSTQENLQQLGYPAIGAIFSRDGYLRFYSVGRAFRVAVSGAGCDKIDEKVFRIRDVAPSVLSRMGVHLESRRSS